MKQMTGPRFVLAPMDGMTHASFRTICFGYGADGATTEMILSQALGRAKRRMSEKYLETLVRLPGEGNLAAQMIGSDRAQLAVASARPRSRMMRTMLLPVRTKNVELAYREGQFISLVKRHNTRIFATLKARR